jgi:hypothetical protein
MEEILKDLGHRKRGEETGGRTAVVWVLDDDVSL